MGDSNERASLDRAVDFLEELEEDRRTAPPELSPVPSPYVARILGSILKCRERRIAGRELDAHLMQIRLSYARDLQKLLPPEPSTPGPWGRSA